MPQRLLAGAFLCDKHVDSSRMPNLWFDSGWPPALADVVSAGYVGYVFYLAPGDNRRPDPTKATLDAYLAAGLDLAMLAQEGKVDIAAGGFDLGVRHAQVFNADADRKGAGPREPILYACDANRTFQQVEAYYRGVLSVPGRPVGAYGGGDLIDALHDRLGLNYFMEAAARAWDTDLAYVSPHTQFWQRDPNVPVGNSAVDNVVPLAPYPTRKQGASMAQWFTFDELVLAAQRTGRPYEVYPGAKDRCRCCSGPHNRDGAHVRPLGPLIGFGRHITGGGLGVRSMFQYITDILVNDSAVPFKSQMAVEPGNGKLWIVGTGRANHILNMSQAAYDALVGGRMALDQFCQNLRGSALVGSTYLLGYEQVAAVAPDAAQSLSTDLHMAELAKMRGWSGVDVAGHGEVASDRGPGDPNEHMGNTRTRIRSRVAGATTPPPQEDDLPTVQDLMNFPLQRSGFPGEAGTTSLGATIAWLDANLEGLRQLVRTQADPQEVRDQIIAVLRADEFNRSGLVDAIAKVVQNLPGGADVEQIKEALRDVLATEIVKVQVSVGAESSAAVVLEPAARSAAHLVDEAPDAPVDDVPPRTTEAESDEYQGVDGQTPLAP